MLIVPLGQRLHAAEQGQLVPEKVLAGVCPALALPVIQPYAMFTGLRLGFVLPVVQPFAMFTGLCLGFALPVIQPFAMFTGLCLGFALTTCLVPRAGLFPLRVPPLVLLFRGCSGLSRLFLRIRQLFLRG